VKHDIPVTMAPAEFQDDNYLLPSDKLINGDLGLTAKALYDYQAGTLFWHIVVLFFAGSKQD